LPKFGNMSKIGKLPITVPQGVTVTIGKTSVEVSSAKETLSVNIPSHVDIKLVNDQIIVNRLSDMIKAKSNHGTIRSTLQNMVTGLTTPWQKQLELIGTGYKALVSANKLNLNVGFIKPVTINIPQNINITVDSDTKITITGANKIVVGQIASLIRKVRPPEPYKGKGIRYKDEFIKLKPGKAAKTAA